jgi:pteridine reductase
MDLRGRIALVTGSGQRLGREIALGLARRGAHVVVHYNHSEAGAFRTAEMIQAMGVKAIAVQANLVMPLEIEQLFVAIEATFGRLDVLVNSASTFQRRDVLEATVEEWNYVMAVNLRAPFLCSQRAAHLMLARGTPGVIINIADVAGQMPWTAYPLHSISKAGLLMLTRVMAKSLGPDIRVNAVVPGPVLKPELTPPERWEQMGAVLPLRQVGQPEHVVQAVVALVENDFITGAVLNVDGGDTLMGAIDML